MATYATHQAAASSVMLNLVTRQELPTEPAAIGQLIFSREACVDALNDRLGIFKLARIDQAPPSRRGVPLAQLDRDPPTLLAQVCADLPRLPEHERTQAPSTFLGTPSPDRTTEGWRGLAIELLAGNHALETAAEKPWLHDHAAAWPILGDIANLTEGVLILDEHLADSGLLTQHTRCPDLTLTRPNRSRAPERLITAHTAKVAAWYGTSAATDLAAPAVHGVPLDRGPVRVITQPADLAAGERRLAGFLRPIHLQAGLSLSEPSLDLTSARLVTHNQAWLCDTLHQASASGSGLATTFAAHRDHHLDIHDALKRLDDLQATGPNQRVLWQQRELTHAIRRFTKPGTTTPLTGLSPAQLSDLAASSHQVLTHTATAVHRQLTTPAGRLREYGKASPAHYRAAVLLPLTAAIDSPAPAATIESWPTSTTKHRQRLRSTLDQVTPTRPAPAPYPRRPRGHEGR